MEIAGMKIVIDADVETPQADTFPVVKVRPTGFSADTVQRILDYFAGNAVLRDLNADVPWMTRDVRDQIIVEELRFQHDCGVRNDILPEEVAAHMDELYGTPPEAAEAAEIPRDDVSTVSESVYFDTGKTVPGTMILEDSRQDANKAFLEVSDFGFFGGYTNERHQEESAAGTGLTAEEAASAAKVTADSLGFDYMDVSDVRVADRYSNLAAGTTDSDQQCYLVLFSRTYAGVKSPFVELRAWRNSGAAGDSSEQYRAPWTPEYLELMINENGVVWLRWQNPVEIVNVEHDDIDIISFEQAKQDFAESMRLVLTGTDFLSDMEEDVASGLMDNNEIHINKVVLGNEFFPVKDSKDEYQLMPCWIFFGYDGWLGDISRDLPTCEMMLDAATGAIV